MRRYWVLLASITLAAQDVRLQDLRRQTDFLSTTLVGVPTQHRALQEERAREGRARIDQHLATTRFPRSNPPEMFSKLIPEFKSDPRRREQAEAIMRAAMEEFEAQARRARWPLDDVAVTLAYATDVEYAVWKGASRLSPKAMGALQEQIAWWLIHNEIFQGFTPQERTLLHEQLVLGAYAVHALRDRETARAHLYDYFGIAPERLTLLGEGRLISDTSDTTPGSAHSGPGRRLVSEYRGSRPDK